MAEILLSLTIIGVVAAITLPSLTGNINERTWNTQRKALYARFSQAIALMPALNGYGTLKEESSAGANDAVDTAAETFVTDGLAKVLKINNICDADHLEDCGIPQKMITIDGRVAFSSFPKYMHEYNSVFSEHSVGYEPSKVVAFETQNGESIAVFYNPNCLATDGKNTNSSNGSWKGYYTQPIMCANFIYDLNGNKGPNTMGKDIGFISALYSTDTKVVAPMPLPKDLTGYFKQLDSAAACTKYDNTSRLPNIDELTSMFYNKALLNATVVWYWASSINEANTTQAWFQILYDGFKGVDVRQNGAYVRCVKR